MLGWNINEIKIARITCYFLYFLVKYNWKLKKGDFTMKCYLMNKNKKVALIEYNTIADAIDNIYEIYDIDYAPLSLKNASKDKSKNIVKELNNWFKGRGIPSWRKDIETLLEKLNVSSREELLNKAFALSLSDQYWLKEENSDIEWKNINFFENDFKYKGYLSASLSTFSNERPDLYSPNNTTDGMLQKAWIIENGDRVLVKGTYEASRQEPINEWLVSNICERLGFEYCNYNVELVDGKLVSKCKDFISSDEEIVTAYDIFNSCNKNNNMSDLEHYIKILEEHNVPQARENIEDMFIVDFLVMNIDRHMKNFGIIRNVNTLEWVRTTPIFDTGEAMNCDKLTSEINFYDGTGKFFTNTNKKFSSYLENIKDIAKIDVNKLEGIVQEYKEMLQKYQPYMEISDERIEKLVEGLEYRINTLNSEIQNNGI